VERTVLHLTVTIVNPDTGKGIQNSINYVAADGGGDDGVLQHICHISDYA
jgi:hypothetical protein